MRLHDYPDHQLLLRCLRCLRSSSFILVDLVPSSWWCFQISFLNSIFSDYDPCSVLWYGRKLDLCAAYVFDEMPSSKVLLEG